MFINFLFLLVGEADDALPFPCNFPSNDCYKECFIIPLSHAMLYINTEGTGVLRNNDYQYFARNQLLFDNKTVMWLKVC